MERFKAKTKFLQYQLWQECNNGCPFCSERNQFKIDKAWALRFTLEKLDLPETKDYWLHSTVSDFPVFHLPFSPLYCLPGLLSPADRKNPVPPEAP